MEAVDRVQQHLIFPEFSLEYEMELIRDRALSLLVHWELRMDRDLDITKARYILRVLLLNNI